MTGAPGGIRTHDPWLRRPILYPLSYGRVCRRDFITRRIEYIPEIQCISYNERLFAIKAFIDGRGNSRRRTFEPHQDPDAARRGRGAGVRCAGYSNLDARAFRNGFE